MRTDIINLNILLEKNKYKKTLLTCNKSLNKSDYELKI